MLGKDSQFKESALHADKKDRVDTVSFPDDNFEAMAIVAKIIYLRSEEVPTTISCIKKKKR